MNKDLTPLQALKEIKDYVVNGQSLALTTEEKGFPLIETALKENEQLKEEVCKLTDDIRKLKDDISSQNAEIQRYLLEKEANENQRKALEIIKEKSVDVSLMRRDFGLCDYNLKNKENKLTQEEYELLKEVLL